MLSVVIPSYKDPLLYNTINSLLLNARGEVEVIAVLDGYEPDKVLEDKRVTYIHQENKGMREAINTAVSHAKGEYLMRTDEHCCFGVGYDVLLTENMENNWIVNPRRYRLDTEKWQVMDYPPIDYEKLLIERKYNKFHGIEWTSRTNSRKHLLIDEDMAMQGSCWAMPHRWWDKTIQYLDTATFGDHYQDSVEMCMKTWQAGGHLMINKKTWYAHKHREFARTHNYPRDKARHTWDKTLEVYGEYYEDVIFPRWFQK